MEGLVILLYCSSDGLCSLILISKWTLRCLTKAFPDLSKLSTIFNYFVWQVPGYQTPWHEGNTWRQFCCFPLTSPGSQIVIRLPSLIQVATNMSVLPSVSVYNFRYPTTEELKTYTTQLEDLRQEASHLQSQVAASRYVFSSLQYQRRREMGHCELVRNAFIE